MPVVHNHGLPIDHLKNRRRELALAMAKDDDIVPTDDQIAKLANVHHAIAALEVVKKEIDGFY